MDIDTLAERSKKCAFCKQNLSWLGHLADAAISTITLGRVSLFSKYIEKDQVWVHTKCEDEYILDRYL